MPRKPKFRPRITKVKLNPEQAVLQCACFSTGLRPAGVFPFGEIVCYPGKHLAECGYITRGETAS